MALVVLVAVLSAGYAFVSRSPGYFIAIPVAALAIVAAALAGRAGATRPFETALGLGAALLAGYVVATPPEAAVGVMRLGQVAILAVSPGIVLALILARKGIEAIPAPPARSDSLV